jgi:hypothetical protein
MKKIIIIVVSLILLIIISIGAGIYFKTEKEKKAIVKESNNLAEEVKYLTSSGIVDEENIKKINVVLEKLDSSRYENTEAKAIAEKEIYNYAIKILRMIKSELDKKTVDYVKVEMTYNLLKNLKWAGVNITTTKGYIEEKAKEFYNNIYKELIKVKPNMDIVNKNYNILVKNLNYTDYRVKAENDIKNQVNIRKDYLIEEAKRKEEVEKAKKIEEIEEAKRVKEYQIKNAPLDYIEIGDPLSNVYRLKKGYYEESTSEASGIIIKHFYGRGDATYKYITVTNGFVDYISY